MRVTRVALPFGLLSLVFGLASLAASAVPPAYVDNVVRDAVREGGTAKVIIQFGDASQPDMWAASPRQRIPAIRAVRSRVLSAVPAVSVRRSYSTLPFVAATVDAATLEKVAARPEVEAVFPDRPVKAVLNTSGPLLGQPQAEAEGATGAGVGVAVIDTGIDWQHPSFNPPGAKFFTDIKPGFWAWRNIEAVAAHALVSGYKDGAYHPEYAVTRDQMAVFLARGLAGSDAGVPAPPAGTQSFSDVPPTHWAYRYIEYCKSQNVAGGYKDGSYNPTGTVTRAQMAVFLARAVAPASERPSLPGYTPPPTSTFTDVATTYWAFKEVEYVAARSVASGFPDHSYHPEDKVNRGQMAVFISRAFHISWEGRVIGGVNILLGETDPGRPDPMDDYFHGTMVAGVVASMDPTYRGIAPGANLIGVKVLDQDGNGYSSDVIAGIQWCLQNKDAYGIKVLNLSLGDGMAWTSHEACDSQPEAIAIQEAVEAGILVVVASGNEYYTNGISLPACASAAVSVGATKDGSAADGATPVDGIATYGDRGELMTLYAPGTWITSPQAGAAGGGFATYDGTSFSAPHVAAAAAVLFGEGMTTPAEVRDRLTQTGVQIVDPATGVGSPRVDLTGSLHPLTTGVDLVVSAVSSTSSSAFTGDAVPLSLTVRNQGTATSSACQAVVVLSANSTVSRQDPVLATVSVPALAAGASQSFTSFSGILPAMPGGSYWLGGYVDSSYAVREMNEVNNDRKGAAFTVNVPSSRVVSMTLPATMQAGKSYSVSLTLRNDGTTEWVPGTYALAAVAPEGTARWGKTSVALPRAVAPDTNYTFSFTITAPTTPGSYACHWSMKKGDTCFGEVAAGGTKDLVLDDAQYGQDYPSASGKRVAFMDYKSGWYRANGIPVISVKDLSAAGKVVLPDDIPNLINPNTGYPDPPFSYFDISNNWYPSLSGTWVAWMTDDRPNKPEDPQHADVWYFQVVAYNLATPNLLPRRVTLQAADAWYPCVEGTLVVWEDYRNDADGMPDANDFLLDNPDIYISDLTVTTDQTDKRTAVYPICTAPGPQFSPRLSDHYVVWEDWRDGQSDIYCYDLRVDSDSDGIPNWKETSRPSPDPAERRLTNNPWLEGYPDVSGETAVWLDYSRYTGLGSAVDIISQNLNTSVQTPVVTEPAAYRQQVRVDGTQVVWEDWRSGGGDIYWSDLMNPAATARLGASVDYEGAPDIGGSRVAYSKYRTQVTTNGQAVDVYNVWTQKLLPYVEVTP